MSSSRVTNSMLTNNVLRDLMNNKLIMDKYNRQLATTRKVNYAFDDPVGAVTAMQMRAQLYRLDTYQGNLADAKAYLTESESALSDMNKVVQRAYELVIDASTDVKTASDRQAIANEILRLRDGILEDLNATHQGKYIFGGFNTTEKPFVVKREVVDAPRQNVMALANGIAGLNGQIAVALPGDVPALEAARDQLLTQLGSYGAAAYDPMDATVVTFNGNTLVSQTTVTDPGPMAEKTMNVLYYNGTALNKYDALSPAAVAAGGSNDKLAKERTQVRQYEVGFDALYMDVGMTGLKVTQLGTTTEYAVPNPKYDPNDPASPQTIDIQFDNNLWVLMDDLYNQLSNPDTDINCADMSKRFISKLQQQQQFLLANIAELGGMYNRVQALTSRYEGQILNYTERKSLIEDADMAEAATRFAMAKSVYESALAASAKLIQPSLMDYLR